MAIIKETFTKSIHVIYYHVIIEKMNGIISRAKGNTLQIRNMTFIT